MGALNAVKPHSRESFFDHCLASLANIAVEQGQAAQLSLIAKDRGPRRTFVLGVEPARVIAQVYRLEPRDAGQSIADGIALARTEGTIPQIELLEDRGTVLENLTDHASQDLPDLLSDGSHPTHDQLSDRIA